MRGWLIGIPLTVMQLHVHDPLPVVHVADVINNVALGSAIYDADRLLEGDERRWITHASAAVSCAYYASDDATRLLVPCVLTLHLWYAAMKPYIGPIKPFVVAFFWTVAVCAVPLLRAGVSPESLTTPAAFFLCIAATSHLADMADVLEDEAAGIRTPAVIMGRNEAWHYALALGFAACVLYGVDHTSATAEMLFLGSYFASWPRGES